MRVIGVDPGSGVTGFGVLEVGSRGVRPVAAGTIRPRASERGAGRLGEIYRRLLAIISRYAPEAMSLERHFVAANPHSALRLGEARAVAMLAAVESGMELFEYAPNEVKLAVAGYGHADKKQVKFMVRRALGVDDGVRLADDASDALALALCHLGRVANHGSAACGPGRPRSRRRALP
jgi:crossover junction endodeoxyribonuclease RuvC